MFSCCNLASCLGKIIKSSLVKNIPGEENRGKSLLSWSGHWVLDMVLKVETTQAKTGTKKLLHNTGTTDRGKRKPVECEKTFTSQVFDEEVNIQNKELI